MYKVDMSKLHPGEQNWFCAGWPEAKKFIKKISSMTGNIFVVAGCALVLAVGNTIANKICNKS